MQLCETGKRTKYRIYFNELETNNLIKILGNNISIRNIQLCSYIEKILPKNFDICNNKRIMVLNIFNNALNISADVLLQDINVEFLKPKEKFHYFKITQITFKDGYVFKNWLLQNKYSYKIIDVAHNNNVKVLIYNMTENDEMHLSEIGAEIEESCNMAKYLILHTADKLEKYLNQIA